MNRPPEIKKYPAVDLKLGIKSSLPHAKSTIALLLMIWESMDYPSSVQYSSQKGDALEITATVKEALITEYAPYYTKAGVSENEFVSVINSNQLLKSQIEALIVAFELIWRIARFSFADNSRSLQSERTGGIRYPKVVKYTSVTDALDTLVSSNKDAYAEVLLNWLGLDIVCEKKYERLLCQMLTFIAEDAVFKLADGDRDVIFNQEGLYDQIAVAGEVDINGDKEAKGTLRILKSLLGDGLNPYLKYNNGTVTSAEDLAILEQYKDRVSAYHSIATDPMLDEASPVSIQEDEYQRAAKIILDYIEENGVQFRYSDEEVESAREEFLNKFAPDKLAEIPDEKLLKTLFYSGDGNNDSMCYELEFQAQIRDMFGSIAGGSSYKFGLFQRKEDGVWVTGSGIRPEELSETQALELGKNIRDAIVAGAKLIGAAQLNSKEDYDNLDSQLNEEIGKYATYGWIQKYYQMLYPEKLANFYSSDWLNHLLYALGIEPSETYYGRNGQLAIVKNLTELKATDFADVVFDYFGQPKRFIRLGSSVEDGESSANEWFQRNIVAIGWAELGTLENFRQGNSLNRKALAEALKEKYYPDDPSTSSRKAGEIQEFFNANKDTIFVVMDGEQTIALVDEVGEYYFDPQTTIRAHCKPGEWHQCFNQNEELPVKSEGKLTTCFEIKKPENLLYLYKKYYYELEEVEDNVMNKETPYVPLKYHTGIKSPFAANRIMFGAPGTGKSYNLEQDRKEVLQGGTIGGYERVTFHPDYTYSQFVGTYKPVTDRTGNISYQFVPGPFMRVYVEALRNGRTDKPEPFILLIEEINRANVAAVFGDVFQLLDRDGTNVSEYPIQATEDIRNYLASQLGGTADNYMEIQIPDNMFIWATMNSADQGVFPMDTAFKRRWDFTYLGIDNGEDKIAGKTVVLGKGEHKRNVEWNALRKEINQVLLNDCKVNEDKLMGPFFIAMKNLPEGNEIDAESFTRIFKNKVIMYLFDDAAKQKRPTLFDGCDIKNLYSAICEEFDEKGVDIFSESVRSAFPVPADGDEE